MNKTQTTSDLKTLWLEATGAYMGFYTDNIAKWSPEVDEQYRQLKDKSERLFVEWRAAVSGKSTTQIEAEINKTMHSRFD
jgi:hypothetical protein